MNNFWQKLKKEKQTILALAPMAGVADSAFRQICKRFGADVLYSEMASVAALAYAPEKTLELIEFNKIERPYVVQLFGCDPKQFALAAKLVEKKIKPDGFDVNFGCPVPKVIKQGAGSALMKDLKTARKVVENLVKSTALPVSVKIRSKSGEVDALRFLDNIDDLDVKAVMIHGRSFSQGFAGPIDCKIIKKSRDYFGGVILANGGAIDAPSALDILAQTKADGLGVARGALGRPWLFREIKNSLNNENENTPLGKKEVFEIAGQHALLAEKLKGKQGIIEMRKHLCWYAQGLSGAKKLREKFVAVESMDDVEQQLATIDGCF